MCSRLIRLVTAWTFWTWRQSLHSAVWLRFRKIQLVTMVTVRLNTVAPSPRWRMYLTVHFTVQQPADPSISCEMSEHYAFTEHHTCKHTFRATGFILSSLIDLRLTLFVLSSTLKQNNSYLLSEGNETKVSSQRKSQQSHCSPSRFPDYQFSP